MNDLTKLTASVEALKVKVDAFNAKPPVVPAVDIQPAIDALATLAAIDGVNDLVIMHDYSETTGQKEKKITFDAFKTALNIPAGSTDEKVAVISGGTAGYIWGTDGTDGIVRMGTSMSWAKGAGNAFVTLDVSLVDGGTF